MKIMKLTDVGTDVEQYITNPDWVMQQKLDGARMMVRVTAAAGENDDEYDFLFSNDGEKPISFSAAKLKLPMLKDELVDLMACWGFTDVLFDGELIIETGQYWIFDVLEVSAPWSDQIVTHDMTWDVRHDTLVSMFEDCHAPLIQTSPTAYTEDEKRAMWAMVRMTGVEGAVSKHRGSFYLPGLRTTEWVKHKLVKTADLVVTDVRREFKPDGKTVLKGAAKLGVYDKAWTPGQFLSERPVFVDITSASLIGKDLTIDVGDVVEVEYLYYTGTAIIQPRIVRKRTDKESFECDLAQFPSYSRQVIKGS